MGYTLALISDDGITSPVMGIDDTAQQFLGTWEIGDAVFGKLDELNTPPAPPRIFVTKDTDTGKRFVREGRSIPDSKVLAEVDTSKDAHRIKRALSGS